MSKVIDLGFVIHNLEGEVVNETKNVKKDGKVVKDDTGKTKTEELPLTMKGMLITLLPVFPEKEKMVDVWDLGLKVKKNEGKTEFDNDEFNLAKDVITKNSFPNPMPQAGKEYIERYFPFIIAQVVKYFEDIESGKIDETENVAGEPGTPDTAPETPKTDTPTPTDK